MSLTVLADAIQVIAATFPELVAPAAKVALMIIAIVGEDNLQRNPHGLRRFLASKPMKKELAERNIDLTINEYQQIVIRRKLV